MIILERQKLIKILGSLFVALILVISYAAYGSSNSNTSTTATTTVNETAFWSASNVTRVNSGSLSDVFTVQATCANQSTADLAMNYTNAKILVLENQSVQATQLGNEMLVNSGNLQAQGVYDYVEKGMNASWAKCVVFSMKAAVTIPSQLNFKAREVLGTQSEMQIVEIPSSMRSYTLSLSFSNNMTNTTQVTIDALLTENLQIIPGQISVTVS